MNIEIDITYNENNYVKEQFFRLNGRSISVCNYTTAWCGLREYETKDTERTILKQLLQCVKEGVNFKGYGIPKKAKIFNLDKY